MSEIAADRGCDDRGEVGDCRKVQSIMEEGGSGDRFDSRPSLSPTLLPLIEECDDILEEEIGFGFVL